MVRVPSRAVLLTLDHLILRSADPQATLAELAERLGAPVLAEVEEVAGSRAASCGRARSTSRCCGSARRRPPRCAATASASPPTRRWRRSAPSCAGAAIRRRCAARATAGGRSWRALQVHGLLSDPFPVPASTRKPGLLTRVSETAAGLLTKVPALAKAATRKAGRSMVVVTEYEFDADAWRAAAGHGPEPLAIEVGTGGYDWSQLPLAPGPLELRATGAPGITRIVFEGDGESFTLGDVEFEFSSAA